MHCPNCGAPMRVAGPGSYLYCRYCSSFHFPEQSQDGVDVSGIESEQRCPLCRAALAAATVAGEHVLYCQRCHGVLLNQARLAPLVQYLRAQTSDAAAAPRPLNRDDLRRQLHCSHCGQRMDTHPYYGPGNIVIDVCLPCRLVWLDHGEIRAIINAPRWPQDERE